MKIDLAETLQRLYDSEINVTITMLWDGGFDFALVSYMGLRDGNLPINYVQTIASNMEIAEPTEPDAWRNLRRADELAAAIHAAALAEYPDSEYTKLYGRVN